MLTSFYRTIYQKVYISLHVICKWENTIEYQIFHVHITNKASDFENASNFIINYIEQTYNRGHDIVWITSKQLKLNRILIELSSTLRKLL